MRVKVYRPHLQPVSAGVKFLELFSKIPPPATARLRAQSQTSRSPEPPAATSSKIDSIESEIAAELGLPTLIPEPDRLSPAQLLVQQVEEACLLHASGQSAAAAALLADATSRPLPEADAQEKLAWLMRLELARFSEGQQAFEDIALGYASRFETSPPQWPGMSLDIDADVRPMPTLSCRGRLEGDAPPSLAQLEHMALRHPHFRLDLSGVSHIDGAASRRLLHLLQRWQADRIEALITGEQALLELLRAQICAGRRDADDAAWLLLIELLRCCGDLAAHEDACLAYSLTYEMSPPVAVATAARGRSESGCLLLPAEIGLPLEPLLSAIDGAGKAAATLVLDCRQLRRVEFNAASPLLSGIARSAHGKPVEWRDPPYLVSTLLQLVGGPHGLRIVNRKT